MALFVNHLVQGRQGIAESAQPVDQAGSYGFLSIKNGSHIGSHLPCCHHIMLKILPGNFRICRYKICDLLLDPLEIAEGLRGTHHQTGHTHRVDCHAGCMGNKGFFGANRQRDTDGMPPAQNQRNRWLFHPCDHFCNGKSRLNVPAYRIEQKQQTVNIITFFDPCQKRQNMLIFCGFHCFRGDHVPFDLPNDGKSIDIPLFGTGDLRPQLFDLLPLLLFHFRIILGIHSSPPLFSQYIRKNDISSTLHFCST